MFAMFTAVCGPCSCTWRTTLDETPPRFTKLLIQTLDSELVQRCGFKTTVDLRNPTHTNDRIVVIFALNEPGTAYCVWLRLAVR